MRPRSSHVMPRRLWHLFAVLAVVAATSVAMPQTYGATPTCESSSGSGYVVDVCLDAPMDGSTVSGDTLVVASTTVSSGGPGITKLIFYFDGQYLLTDYEAPYQFTLPTDTFVDGTTTLEVEAIMRDSFVTGRTTITLTLANGVTTPPPAPVTFTPTNGTTPPPGQPFVVSATGDGASGQSSSDAVVQTISGIDPNMFIYLGDVYDDGTYTEFKNWYGESDRFGTFASITNPIIGNHERSSNMWPGYDFYWGTPPEWYSFDANDWHFINLNLSKSEDGSNSAQNSWLAADLAANTATCTIASFHLPVRSIGPRGDNPELDGIWAMLVDAGVDIVLTGHDHNYQRWHPLDRDLNSDPSGMTQFVLGAGGHGVQAFVASDPRVAAGADTTAAYGALKLDLNQHGTAFSYVDTDGDSIDSGSIQCSGSPIDTTAPSVPAGVSAVAISSAQVDIDWSPSSDNVGVTSYTVYRDGTPIGTVPGASQEYSDTTTAPNTTYLYTVEAHDAAGNGSGQSTAASVTTPSASPTITVNPEADTYVDSDFPTRNYGTASSMAVDLSPDRRAYMRFDVFGVTSPVISATLRLHSNSTHSQGYEVQGVSDNSWDELTMVHSSSPGYGPSLGFSGPMVPGEYEEIDVTSYVTGDGLYSFALTALSNTNLRVASRESAVPPELVVIQDVSGNSPPTADDLSLSTDEDVAANWTPQVSDPDGDPLTCSISVAPSNGSATVAPDCSSGTYTPDPDYHGPDSFEYEASDALASDSGLVSVTVAPTADAPVADPQAVAVAVDVAETVTLTGSDVDGDCPLTFAIVTPPTNGSLGPITNVQCAAGVASADVVFTPSPGVTGAGAFTFTTEDPSALVSPPATVDLDVQEPASELVIQVEADSYVQASAPTRNYGSSNALRIDGDPERRAYLRFTVSGVSGPVTSATLRVYAQSSHNTGFEARAVADTSWDESSITFDNSPPTGAVIGSSGPLISGQWVEVDVTSHITGDGTYSLALMPLNNTNLRLSSREGSNPPELVVMTDISGNNPPTAGDLTESTDEDVVLNWTPSVFDPDGDPLTCTISSQATNGTATVAPDCSSGTYTPDPDYNGADGFEYQADDGGAIPGTGSVDVTVNPINDAPVASDGSASTLTGVAVTVDLAASDVDGDCPLGFEIVTPPTSGSLGVITNEQCTGGSATAEVVYTPNPGHTGPDSFTFRANDPSATPSNTATVNITVDQTPTDFTFVVGADSYVSSQSPDRNYGSSKQLRTDASPTVRSYLKFDVSALSGSVTSATLRIHTGSSHNTGFEVRDVVGNSWGESTITFNNSPAPGGLLGASGPFSSGQWIEIDVTVYITGDGTFSFALTALTNTNMRLSSRETSFPAELVITTDPAL